jgi:hypothetical protein
MMLRLRLGFLIRQWIEIVVHGLLLIPSQVDGVSKDGLNPARYMDADYTLSRGFIWLVEKSGISP